MSRPLVTDDELEQLRHPVHGQAELIDPTVRRSGHLFEGYGGLSMAADRFFGTTPAWHSEIEPAAVRLLEHHYPGRPNLGDITAVEWADVEPVWLLTGGFPCFTGETPVLTARGYIPISQVAVGDRVLTHANRWRRVTHVQSKRAEVLELPGGIRATGDHPFWTRTARKVWDNEVRRYRRQMSEPTFTPASDIAGQFGAIPHNVEALPTPGLPNGMTWWTVGRWVADGSIMAREAGVRLDIGPAKFEAVAHHLAHWTEHQSATTRRFYLPKSRAAAGWLIEHFGHRAAEKTLPAWLLGAEETIRREFLAGYLAGDGYSPTATQRKAVTVSPCLAAGLRTLAVTLGYTSSVWLNHMKPTTTIEGRTVSQRDFFTVFIADDDHRYTEVKGDHRWVKFRRGGKPAGVDEVFDLTVEEDHTFVAAGFVVHNCQDVSAAGKRAGLRPDSRSGLWSHMARAIHVLRPQVVLIENVRGLLSAEAACEMEPDAWGLGDGADRPLRALGAVLGDLAVLGYDARWCGVRAADAGAPHPRYRVFVVARPVGHPEDVVVERGGQVHGVGAWDSGATQGPGGFAGDPDSAARGERGVAAPGQAEGGRARADAGRSGGTPVADSDGEGREGAEPARGHHLPARGAAADTEGVGRGEGRPEPAGLVGGPDPAVSSDGADWGSYAPAIRRWEHVLGRPAPTPTQAGARGGQQLSPRFVEWLMGVPAGWVTDVPGITRNQALKMLGNGVCPQQAELALRLLTSDVAVGVAA